MKKIFLMVTLTLCIAMLNVTAAYAYEVTSKDQGIAFPNEKILKKAHENMVNNMMKDITSDPQDKRRIPRRVITDTEKQWYTAQEGEEFSNDAVFYTGISDQMHLVTDYRIYSKHVEITSTSTAGTTTTWPTSFTEESSILSNNSRTVQSHAKLIFADAVLAKGIGELDKKVYTIKTTINVEYVKDGIIHFTARSKITG